jgi:hypothetical protein
MFLQLLLEFYFNGNVLETTNYGSSKAVNTSLSNLCFCKKKWEMLRFSLIEETNKQTSASTRMAASPHDLLQLLAFSESSEVARITTRKPIVSESEWHIPRVY